VDIADVYHDTGDALAGKPQIEREGLFEERVLRADGYGQL
jgi:hypothetical protein